MLSFAVGALGFSTLIGSPSPPEVIDTDHYLAATVDTVRWGAPYTQALFACSGARSADHDHDSSCPPVHC
eukprot:scaffold12538_cov105-Isochrysis_galbana.AAC.2